MIRTAPALRAHAKTSAPKSKARACAMPSRVGQQQWVKSLPAPVAQA